LLEWIAWDSFEFEEASCIPRYSFSDPSAFYARSYYAPLRHDLCNSSDHDINLCPYYVSYAQPNFASSWGNTDVVLTLFDTSLLLAQCTRLKMGEPFEVVARFSVVDAILNWKIL